MATFRFLHAADIHLDSPLRGLEADPDAPATEIRNATRLALGNLVDLAIAEDVAFVLIAGDIYDGDWPDYRTGHFFMNQAARLTKAGKPLYVIRGNHDAQNRMTRTLPDLAGMTVFSARRPETHLVDAHGVAIHGQSFSNQAETENLARAYPPPRNGMLNIGLLHTSADDPGSVHSRYAPCTIAALQAHGYEYWALGHIHERAELSRHPDPWIVFPGNLQGRHANETGAKGATLVTVTDGGIAAVEHRVLDAFRWARVAVDLGGVDTDEAAWAAISAGLADALDGAAGRRLAVRVTLEGATALHGSLARNSAAIRAQVVALANQLDPQRLWIEQVQLRTTAALDFEALRGRADLLGTLVQHIDTLASDPPPGLLGDWPATLLGKLTAQHLGHDHALRRHVEHPHELLARARDLLLTHLARDD